MARRSKAERTERYTSGKPASMGDKVRVIATGQDVYLRVLGVDGYVTIYHHTWPHGEVIHISEIEPV